MIHFNHKTKLGVKVNEDVNAVLDKPEYNSNPFTLSFKGFGLFAQYAKNILIIMIILSSIGFLFNALSYIPDSPNNNITPVEQSASVSSTSDPVNIVMISMVILGISGILIVIFAITLLISALYKGFVAAGTVSAMNEKSISVREAFSQATNRLGVLFKAEIITTLKIIGGYILLIVPGVRAQLRYQSTPYIIMSNKDITATLAIAQSKELYKKHLMEAFGIATVGAIIPFIGQSIMAAGMTLSVNQLTQYKTNNLETPKTHWLNYIGLLFIVFVMLLISSAIFLVFALTTA